jgi:cytochrome c-type biogenesis protein CcmE
MFGKQGKAAKAPTSTAMSAKKNGGKVVGGGMVKQGTLSKGTKGNNNKLK